MLLYVVLWAVALWQGKGGSPRARCGGLCFAAPPAMAAAGSWFRGPARRRRSLLGSLAPRPGAFWLGGVVAPGLGVFRPLRRAGTPLCFARGIVHGAFSLFAKERMGGAKDQPPLVAILPRPSGQAKAPH